MGIWRCSMVLTGFQIFYKMLCIQVLDTEQTDHNTLFIGSNKGIFMFNFNKKIYLLLVLFIFIFSFFNTQSASSKEDSTKKTNIKISPEETAKKFYKKYIHMCNNHISPMNEGKTTLKMYISKSLMDKLNKLSELEYAGEYPNINFLKEPDFYGSLDADYFLKSQDIFNDWESHVFIKKSEPENNVTHTVIIVLGATAQSRNTLKARLVRESGAWKIDAVFDMNPQ